MTHLQRLTVDNLKTILNALEYYIFYQHSYLPSGEVDSIYQSVELVGGEIGEMTTKKAVLKS